MLILSHIHANYILFAVFHPGMRSGNRQTGVPAAALKDE